MSTIDDHGGLPTHTHAQRKMQSNLISPRGQGPNRSHMIYEPLAQRQHIGHKMINRIVGDHDGSTWIQREVINYIHIVHFSKTCRRPIDLCGWVPVHAQRIHLRLWGLKRNIYVLMLYERAGMYTVHYSVWVPAHCRTGRQTTGMLGMYYLYGVHI